MKRNSFFKKASLVITGATALFPFDLRASEQSLDIPANNDLAAADDYARSGIGSVSIRGVDGG